MRVISKKDLCHKCRHRYYDGNTDEFLCLVDSGCPNLPDMSCQICFECEHFNRCMEDYIFTEKNDVSDTSKDAVS